MGRFQQRLAEGMKDPESRASYEEAVLDLASVIDASSWAAVERVLSVFDRPVKDHHSRRSQRSQAKIRKRARRANRC